MQATESSLLPTASALAAWLRLEQTDGVGLMTAHALLERFGTPEAIFQAGYDALRAVVKPARARALLAPPPASLDQQVEAVQAWRAQPGNLLLT